MGKGGDFGSTFRKALEGPLISIRIFFQCVRTVHRVCVSLSFP